MLRTCPAIVVSVFLGTSAAAQDVRIPEDFIADRVSGADCARSYAPGRLGSDLNFVAEMAGVRLESTQSILFRHEALSDRWTRLLAVAYGAAARGDEAGARRIVATLVGLAQAGALMDVPTLSQVRGTRCWAGGNRNAPCPIHVVQHTGYAMIAAIVAASVLEEYIPAPDRAVLDRYFAEGYRRFIAPLARDGLRADGLYEFADHGIGVLAYARWTRDTRLASSELRARRASFLAKIDDQGLIDNSSFRGYRGYWYHTLGAEAALGYALVARSFGRDFFGDPALGPRLRNLAVQTARGGADPQLFLTFPVRGDNAARDPADAIPHMHQFASNLPRIIERELGFRVQTAARYRDLSAGEVVSRLIGFDARCYYGSR